jgi:hypothetical protein
VSDEECRCRACALDRVRTLRAERDRLRRELAALHVHVSASWEDECPSEWLLARIDAILRGES